MYRNNNRPEIVLCEVSQNFNTEHFYTYRGAVWVIIY